MKVDQTNLVTFGASLRQQIEKSAHEVDVGENEKRMATQAPPDPKPGTVVTNSKPIVLENAQVRLRFDQDKETGVHLIQVVDAESGKLVRQIPPEELLDVIKALRDIKGFMVSKEI
jgi:flagellar protein FlaG